MFRIGFGYDSHRFDPTRPLMLGGVAIDDAPGLAGHSDADAVLHAVIDGLFGAAGMGDIGEHFPETDDAFAGAGSAALLAEARRRVGAAGWRVVNCDVTVLAEHPRLSPFKAAMRERIAELLGMDERAVAVKAKTNEGMGPVGRGEGIAVMAVVLITAG
ncbi:MAG: 2-C-methyl-D-erythritol 2,4-cyclodiphosphate synthase [Planctomycetota bacterium]